MVKELVELLRQARQEKGISLPEISEQTRIQRYYLEALETGNFHRFPAEVYLKGALRSYAAAVGLDPGEVLTLYRSLKGEGTPSPEPVTTAPAKKVKRRTAQMGKGPSLLYGLIVLALALVLGGYWFVEKYWPEKRPDPSGDHSKSPGPAELWDPEEPVKPGKEDPEGKEPAPPEDSAKIALLAAQSTSRETVFSVRNVESLELELTCTDRCWIRILVDDEEEFAPRNFQKGEKAAALAEERIWIRLGHPPGAEVKFNGVTVDEIGQQKNAHNFLFIHEK